MMRVVNLLMSKKKLLLPLFITIFLLQCSDEGIIVVPVPDPTDSIPSDTIPNDTTSNPDPNDPGDTPITCSSCTYVVQPNKNVIDGQSLNLKPGSVICLNAATQYPNLIFRNLTGTAQQPIIIRNCGGTARVVASGQAYSIKFQNCKYFRLTGAGEPSGYGIRVSEGHLGITVESLSTNFEIDHVEVYNTGFAGIMAKTDPTCDNATIRGNFTMYDVSLHDNYVHDTDGEGLYVGNSFWENGVSTSCGQRFPHDIHGVKIYNNIVKNSGWEGIQLGCATKGAEVYNNTIENFGTANNPSQSNGIQIGAGTGGLCYNNFIKKGNGNGIIVLGLGDNVIFNNIIIDAGENGIFCDERGSTGSGFTFINNTIIRPADDGLRNYAELLSMNRFINNIVADPGAKHVNLRSGVKMEDSNNLYAATVNEVNFVNAAADNYRLKSGSPAIDKGKNVSSYNIKTDFYGNSRPRGSGYDIGASEF